MNPTLEEIISAISDATTSCRQSEYINISDLSIQLGCGYQLIFGVTKAHSVTRDLHWYRDHIARSLSAHQGDLDTRSFPFSNKEDLQNVLLGLSNHYNADLDTERMMAGKTITDDDYGHLCVTIVTIPMAVSSASYRQ